MKWLARLALAAVLTLTSCSAFYSKTVIPVYFHDPHKLETHAQLIEQVDRLNAIYAAEHIPITFRFAGEDASYKHVGTAKDLNVGIEPMLLYLGMTQEFPWDIATNGLEPDFILLDPDALLGDNSGWILAHEVGHWLGLFHTKLPGNCMDTGPGDLKGCHFTDDQRYTMIYFSQTIR